jgi:phosphatidylserine synthase
MADMTTTGISVSIFIYATYQNIVSSYIYYHIVFIAVLILYLSTNIIRLASFTTMKEKNIFIGLPAPASAIILLMLTFLNVGFVYILAGLVIISFLLISNIRFPKPGFKIDAMAAVLIILTLILWENYYNIAPLLLLTSLVLYAVIGPIYLLKHK